VLPEQEAVPGALPAVFIVPGISPIFVLLVQHLPGSAVFCGFQVPDRPEIAGFLRIFHKRLIKK